VILVQTEKAFYGALDMLRQASIISVDTETYGRKGEPVKHPAQGNRIIGFSTHCVIPQFNDYSVSFYFPFRHQVDEGSLNLFNVSDNLPIELLPKFAEVLNRNDVLLIWHHLKFDAQMFRADDLWLLPNVDNVQDLLPKGQLIDENMSHRLKDMGALVFGDHVKREEEGLNAILKKNGGYYHRTTPAEMSHYACRDAQLTHDVNPYIDQELERQGLMHLVRREMEFQLCLMEMEWEGINFDQPLAERLSKAARKRMREVEDELGFDPQKRDALAHELFASRLKLVPTANQEGFGPGPSVMMLPEEFKLTKNKSKEFPDGVPVMDEQTLVNLRDPIADLVLEYRGLGKADSTWYNGWIKRVGHDGRIHPTYNHADKKAKYGTVTSRLSSFIQQMPRDPDAMVKLLLKPDCPEHTMVEYDYMQIEYREAACYAQDDDLIDQFRAGLDTHQILAQQIGIDRQSAKTVVYTLIFGGGAETLAKNIEKQVWLNEKQLITFPVDQAEYIINSYYKVHPKIKMVSNRARSHAKKYGYVTLWNGRKRHFYAHEPWTFRKAFNSVLQGGAAQIIEESMLMIHRRREQDPFRMRVQVHDSLWFSQPLDRFDEHAQTIKGIMEWPSKKFPVPFPVDYKIIRGWELGELSGTLIGSRSGGDDGMGSI